MVLLLASFTGKIRALDDEKEENELEPPTANQQTALNRMLQ